MKSYWNKTCSEFIQCKPIQRIPLKELQRSPLNCLSMSTTSKKNGPIKNIGDSNVSLQNKQSNIGVSIPCSKERSVFYSNDCNSTKSSLLPKTRHCDKISEPSKACRAAKSKSDITSTEKQKQAVTENCSGSNVKSLSSSPKWSRIKDKFEKQEGAEITESSVQNLLSNNTVQRNDTCTPSLNAGSTSSKLAATLKVPHHSNISDKNTLRTNSENVAESTKTNISKPLSRQNNPRNVSALKKNESVTASNRKSCIAKVVKSSGYGAVNDSVKSETITKIKNVKSPLNSQMTAISQSPVAATAVKKNVKDSKINISTTKSKTAEENKVPTSKPQQLLKVVSKDVSFGNSSKPIKITTQKCENTKLSQGIEKKLTDNDLKKTLYHDVTSKKGLSTNPSSTKDLKISINKNENNLPIIESKCDENNHFDIKNKSVWVKDSAGNWVRNTSEHKSDSLNTGDLSKVALLRQKFSSLADKNEITSAINCSTKCNSLSKSNTATNVPNKLSFEKSSKKLYKSSTVGNIPINQLKEKASDKNIAKEDIAPLKTIHTNERESRLSSSTSSYSSSSEDSAKSTPSSERSPEKIRKLSIVQRAVLSYEENLALLSPETQRKLKLLGEKVKAQTDDDKLLAAKCRNDVFTCTYNKKSDTEANPECVNGNDNSSLSRTNVEMRWKLKPGEVGDPIQPVRSFLTRYQNMYKSVNDCKPANVDSNNKKVSDVNSTQKDFKTNIFEEEETARKTFDISQEPVVNNCYQNSKSNLEVEKQKDTLLCQLRSRKNSSPNQKLFQSKLPKNKLNHSLQPNASFLWKQPSVNEDDIINIDHEENTDSHKYYVLENYYSPLEFESELSHSENSSQNRCPSQNLKLTAGEARYQNIVSDRTLSQEKNEDDVWTDLSEDELYSDAVAKKTSSNSSSSVKWKNKRFTHYSGQQQQPCSQTSCNLTNNSEISSKNVSHNLTEVNDDKGLNSVDATDSSHYYEPLYESLGNYLISDDKESISLSPDDDKGNDFMHSSCSSLESIQSDQMLSNTNDGTEKQDVTDSTSNGIGKKTGDKIRQLKRHLSWTKSDIRLELSSKFNKIKIKKNSHNATEIGVKVHENNQANTSPKKNTFIKCILKQKSANVPIKRSPSPKKESALFYVHLSMSREKQRPFSDSCVENSSSSITENNLKINTRKCSEPTLKISHFHSNRFRKGYSGHIQRPKTPPPLPPTHFVPKNSLKPDCSQKQEGGISLSGNEINKENSLYAECKSTFSSNIKNLSSISESSSSKSINNETKTSTYISEVNDDSNSLYSSINFVPSVDMPSNKKRNSVASCGSFESYTPADESGSSGASSSTYSSGFMIQISESGSDHRKCKRTASGASDMSLTLVENINNELLKSPFEEEPLYQFYHKDVQQRATLWYSADGSESEFEDYPVCKISNATIDTTAKHEPLQKSQMSAMDLIHGEGGQRTLWCEVPEVQKSGILEKISPQDRKIQEAMFEVITSEASYLKSLNFLLEHFAQCPEFSGEYSQKHVLDKRERHILFSDVPPVRNVSASLLADLEKRWLENIMLSNVCDIIYEHANKYFSVYVKYCSNQIYQDRTLKQLKESRPHFVEVLKRLESSPVCQGLDMHSFLMLPMQRITRLPLLIDAIFHRLSVDSPIYESCKMALAVLNKLVTECNEGARRMERMEEMLVISHQLDFRECKGLGLLSASRWLVKKGELVRLIPDTTNKRTFGRNIRWCKIRLFLFLFTDLLVVTRKKSDDTYCVIDYCPRNMVQVMSVDENTPSLPSRLPSSYRNIFQMIMLNNSEGKTIEMLLSCLLESDRTRWMDAVTPAKSENPDEKIYEEWDCPQVQCTYAYCAQQPDELSIEEADVVNVFRKMADGWYEGERIRDGVRGWFPSSHTVEIISSHIRARNLRQRYRLLMLTQSYLEQQKAQATSGKGK